VGQLSRRGRAESAWASEASAGELKIETPRKCFKNVATPTADERI
jgi:hypothetical protein